MSSPALSPLPSDIFAKRLRAERTRQGLSQAELARRVARLLDQHVETTMITRIEQQTRAVRLDEFVALATALNVEASALIMQAPVTDLTRQIHLLTTKAQALEERRNRIDLELQLITRQLTELRAAREANAGPSITELKSE